MPGAVRPRSGSSAPPAPRPGRRRVPMLAPDVAGSYAPGYLRTGSRTRVRAATASPGAQPERSEHMAFDGHRPIGGVGQPEPSGHALPPLARAGTLTVGVIDTGIVLDDRGRPPSWFGRHHLSYCAEEDADVPSYPLDGRLPTEGHGTFVAGLVLREAPSARVRMYGALARARVPSTVDESTERDDKAVAAALAALALNRNVQVVNLSFGDAVRPDEEADSVLVAAVRSFLADRPDVAVVAASGNSTSTDEFLPAAIEHVLSVGAVDETGLGPEYLPPVATFSTDKDWIRAYASGVNVRGPLPQADGQQWARWSGSSFAAAIVSGRIAQVAIERGVNGREAETLVMSESDDYLSGKWVRSVDTVPRPSAG